MFHGLASHTGYAGVMGPQTATLKWKLFTGKMPTSSNSPPTSIAVSPQGNLYVGGSQAIFALDGNGKMVWYKNYTGVQGPAAASDGTVHFVSGHSIDAVDSLGNQKWQYTTGNSTIFGTIIGPDGTIYQGSWDHYFYAVNPDGTLKRKYLTAGAVSYSPSIGADGTIYLGGDAHAGGDPNLYAFDSSGNLRWKYNAGAPRGGTPAVTSSGTIYVAASGVLDAFSPTGQLQWNIGAPPAPPSQPGTHCPWSRARLRDQRSRQHLHKRLRRAVEAEGFLSSRIRSCRLPFLHSLSSYLTWCFDRRPYIEAKFEGCRRASKNAS